MTVSDNSMHSTCALSAALGMTAYWHRLYTL